jgi:hypothetical protein
MCQVTLQLRPKDERGAVMVMVALFLPILLIFASFAIDGARYWTFSRNIQNKADAAAFSAALQYGNTCFSTPTQAQLDSIGHAAQQYAGVPVGANDANLPYPRASVANYQNLLDNPGSAAGNYHLVLNGAASADHGGTSFSKGNFCSATYDSPADAAADVWVTQEKVPTLLPLFGFAPNISAHARVQLQQIQSETGVRPIAVGDAAYIPCVTANFLNNDGAVIASEKLTRIGNSSTWSSIGDAKNIQIPATAGTPVTVQMFLWDCSSTSPSGLKYDYYNAKGQETQIGLVNINNWGTPTAVGANGPPQVAAGGVHLTGATGTTCDPYFQSSTIACQIGVHANIQFQPAAAGVTFFARAQLDNGATIDLTNTGGTDWDSNLNTFTIAADSGSHSITILTAQTGGKVGATNCKNNNPWNNNNKGCQTTVTNAVQRTFAGTNGTNTCNNPPYDTGPLQWIDVGTTDNPIATAGANAYAAGANPHLYITTSIQGLSNSLPTDPDICLRVAEQVSHATDLVDCGQGNGTPADVNAIVNGCPDPPGVQKNIRVQPDGSLTCTPQITPWDCVGNNPGESPPVLRAFDQLVGQGNAPSNCAPNNWNTGNVITLADPRAMPMIVTGPTDLGTTNGTGKIPIRDFAVFYVTGWSTGKGGVKGCNNNDPPPAGAGTGEIWGHWTSIVVPSGSGTSNGQQCDTADFGNCVAVLTR